MALSKVFISIAITLAFIACCSCEADGEPKDRYLTLPKLDKCNARFKEAQYKNRNFFYSGHDPELKDKKLDWLDARNTCRDRCMETVSFEDQEKYEFYKSFIEKNDIKFIWTSGRLCDFEGCEGRWDLLPKRVKGWLWSANQVPISPTDKAPPGWKYQPWSSTGLKKKPQPDNAEFFLNQESESCLGILNNMYNDSIAWHDIACYHRARFICEDSEELLKEVHEKKEEMQDENISTNPEVVKTTTEQPKVGTLEKTAHPNAAITEREKQATEKASTQQTRRRKVIKKKLVTEANATRKTNDNDDNSNDPIIEKSTATVPEDTTVTEAGNVLEEVETTTIVEVPIPISTKRPSRVRGGGRRRLQQ